MKEWNAVIRKGMLFLAAAFLCLLAIPQKASAVEVNQIEIGDKHLQEATPCVINGNPNPVAADQFDPEVGGAIYKDGKLHLYNYDGPQIMTGSGTDKKPLYVVLHGDNKITGEVYWGCLWVWDTDLFITTEGDEAGSLIVQKIDQASGSVTAIQAGNGGNTGSVYIQKNAQVTVNMPLDKTHSGNEAVAILSDKGNVYVKDHAKLAISISGKISGIDAYGIRANQGMLDISTDQEVSINVSQINEVGYAIFTPNKSIKLTNTPKLTILGKNTTTTGNTVMQLGGSNEIAGYYFDPTNTNDYKVNSPTFFIYEPLQQITLSRAVLRAQFSAYSSNKFKLGPGYGNDPASTLPSFSVENITYADGTTIINNPAGKPLDLVDGRWEVYDESGESWKDATAPVGEDIYRFCGTVKAFNVGRIRYDMADDMVISVIEGSESRVEWNIAGQVDRSRPDNNAQVDVISPVTNRVQNPSWAHVVDLENVKFPIVGKTVDEQLDKVGVLSSTYGTKRGDQSPYFYESDSSINMAGTAKFEYGKNYHLVIDVAIDEDKAYPYDRFAPADHVELYGVGNMPFTMVS